MNFEYSKFRVNEGDRVSLKNLSALEDGGYTKKQLRKR